MSVYTVYEPPLRAAGAAREPERFAFIREGFYFWAVLLPPLWMLWSRMWLVLVIYLVVAVGVENAMHYAGVGAAGVALVQLAIALIVGLEAANLRRFTLVRRGWRNVGVVSGDDLEQAERRFFDAWVRAATPRPRAEPPATPATSAAPAAATTVPAAASRPASPPDIIGLFPDPGATR